jgi:hypothetical protein
VRYNIHTPVRQNIQSPVQYHILTQVRYNTQAQLWYIYQLKCDIKEIQAQTLHNPSSYAPKLPVSSELFHLYARISPHVPHCESADPVIVPQVQNALITQWLMHRALSHTHTPINAHVFPPSTFRNFERKRSRSSRTLQYSKVQPPPISKLTPRFPFYSNM